MKMVKNSSEWFMLFLANNNNIDQNIAIIETINKSQLKLLKDAANDILEEVIPLNTQQFKKLFQYQDFIRLLGEGRLTPEEISEDIGAITEICKVVYPQNEICNKTSAPTSRRLEQSEKTSTAEKYFKYSRSRETSPRESHSETDHESSDEENGDEEERKFETDGEEDEEYSIYNKFTTEEI